jgi:hypothetical protein
MEAKFDSSDSGLSYVDDIALDEMIMSEIDIEGEN